MHTLSREALYARVWAEPMPTLAACLGVGASPLRQACHDAGIPMPGRGHWTRLQAGKPIVQAPLPPRGPAMAQRITLATPGLDGVEAWQAELASSLPEPPVFDEPIEAVRARTAAQLGPITVQPHLERACAGIRRLLVADDLRRAARKARRASPDCEVPLFDSPFEQRRLRLLNSLAFGLGRVDARLDLGGRTGREIAVLAGRQRVTFTLDAPGALSVQGEWNVRPRPEGPLVLKITAKGVLELTPSSWADCDAAPLDDQLTDIAVGLLVAAEVRYRAAEISGHRDRIARRAEIARDLARRQADAERRRDQRESLKADARRKRLHDQAQDWRTARDIRSFVAEVIETLGDGLGAVGDLAEWRAWALAEAEALDPATRGGPEPWGPDDDDALKRRCGCGSKCERGCGCGLRMASKCDCPGEQDQDDERWLRFPEP